MASFEERIRSLERTLDTNADDDGEEEIDVFTDRSQDRPTTLEGEQWLFRSEDKKFWDMFSNVYGELCRIIDSRNQERYYRFVLDMQHSRQCKVCDHLQRNLLHVAIEQSNITYVKFLVDVGIDVNMKEGCGLTALNLAVLKKDRDICKFLVDSGARYDGSLFTSIPSPKEMATKIMLVPILEIFQIDMLEREQEDELIAMIDKRFSANVGREEESGTELTSEVMAINRSSEGFITHVVGDVGTCTTNEAVMARSSAYRLVGTCPVHLHNKGYFCEAAFKVHGSSGLHYLLVHLLHRKQLTAEVFKDKKFNDYNLEMVREGIRDGCRSYGLAAVFEFMDSNDFPTAQELAQSEYHLKEHGPILLDHFKVWLEKCSQTDPVFKHRASAFLFYAPLLQLYDEVTNFGDGYAREIVYQLQIPVYKQLQFKNYFSECFRHVFNMFKWPLTARKLLWQNCCVNTSGQTGKGIELDAFVESEVVKPIKQYSSGHSTVTVCERIMGNLDLFKAIRKRYAAKDCFDIHHTRKHSVPKALHDQVKGCWFVLKKGLFKCDQKKKRLNITHSVTEIYHQENLLRII